MKKRNFFLPFRITKCMIFLFFLFLPFEALIAQDPFTELQIDLKNVRQSSVAWGDYDGDGDLDIALTGVYGTMLGTVPFTGIYRNDNGVFTEINHSIPGLKDGTLEWGDYDNDGDLDLLVSGCRWDSGCPSTGAVTSIYRNDGQDTFTWVEELARVSQGDATWGDYDNDGDLDVAIMGVRWAGYYRERIARIFRNDNGDFNSINAVMIGVDKGMIEWVDYDNDGDLDIFLMGCNALTGNYQCATRVTKIYENDEGEFFDAMVDFIQVSTGEAAWGDYDNDGDLDVVLSGISDEGPVIKIYQNLGNGGFYDITPDLSVTFPEIFGGELSWVDYDNDGDLDLMIAGREYSNYRHTVFYENTGADFVEVETDIIDVGESAVDWGDYDNDGDLDLLITGQALSGIFTKIYQNNSAVANTLPGIPSGLNATVDGTRVTFSWNPSLDTETPQPGISYNLRIGTSPGSNDALSPMSDTITGYRHVPRRGNTQFSTIWTLNLEAETDFYWSVQAVDSARAGSPFAGEETFCVPGPDLGITMEDSPDPCLVNSNLTYTIIVENLGPTDATEVVVTDSLPDDMSFVSFTTSQGGGNATRRGLSNGWDVTYQLGTLTVGSQATMTITVKPLQSITYTNTAEVTSREVDPDLSNNSVTVSTEINRRPYAHAGPDQTVYVDEACQAQVTLDGSGSSDPDGDTLTYTWEDSFVPVDGVNPTVTLGLGDHYITLTVNDGHVSDTDIVIIYVEDNTPPVPNVNPLPVIRGECSAQVPPHPTATDNCSVQITGTTIDPLSYSEQGSYIVTWIYDDGNGNITTQFQTVIVEDITPPSIDTISASPDVIWPPNHKMVQVTINASVSDNCDTNPTCQIISISSNEPENGLGDGDTAPDWEISGDLTANLRAERSGNGSSRVYTITVRCTDYAGNSSDRQVTVTVPHDQKKK